MWTDFTWELPGIELSREERLAELTRLLELERDRLEIIRDRHVQMLRRELD